MSKLLVVVGATGQQGGSVADVYAKEPGWKVRGLSRNPEKAANLTAKGIEVVKADLNDRESLVAAFKGADAIFTTTDPWTAFFDPATRSLLKPGQTINEYCYDVEVQQGKNVADVAASMEGLDRFIVSALCDVKKWSRGKYTSVYHFDSKARIVEYVKEKYPKLAEKMSVVQLGGYMNNWKTGLKPTKQADGTYRLIGVGSGKNPLTLFHPSKDTGHVVRVALQTSPGKNILGTGSTLSWTDYLRVWCEVNNVPFGDYDEIPIETFEQNFPLPGLGKEYGEMFRFIDEFGYTGGDPSVVHAEDLGVPCPLTTWEEYVRSEDWSSVISA